MNKYIKITLIIFIVLGAAGFGYYILQNNSLVKPLLNFGGQLETPTINSNQTAQKLTTITSNPIFDYWVSNDTIFTIDDSGRILKSTNEIVNSQTLPQLNNISVAPNGQSVIARFNYPIQPSFAFFDLAASTWQPLPTNTIAAAWSPDTKQIIYLRNQTNSGSLYTLSLATQKSQEISTLTQSDAKLTWPRKDEVLISTQSPSRDISSSLWNFNLSKKTIKPLIKDEYGLVVQWSQTGELGIKLHNLNRQPALALIDSAGNTLTNLSFVTLPEKCLITEQKIYCAVPRSLRDGVAFPDDYYKKAIYFKDDIYLFNLSDGSNHIILNGDDKTIDATHLSLKGNKLLFLNRYDNKLYSLDL